jgi:DNA-binding CsgD family transcriptional regulator
VRPPTVSGGASMLTAREREVMLLAAEGLSNTKIARRLGISDNTVRVHLQHIYRKLRIRDRTTLAAMTVSSESRIIKLWRRGYVHEGPRFYSLTIYFLRTDTIDRPDPNMPATDIYNKQCQTNM